MISQMLSLISIVLLQHIKADLDQCHTAVFLNAAFYVTRKFIETCSREDTLVNKVNNRR